MKNDITTHAATSRTAREAFFTHRDRLSCLRIDKAYGTYSFRRLSEADLEKEMRWFDVGFYLTEEKFYVYEFIEGKPVLTEWVLPAERLEALNQLFLDMTYTYRLSDEKIKAMTAITGFKPTERLADNTLVVYAELPSFWGNQQYKELTIAYRPETIHPFYLSLTEIRGAACVISTGPEFNTLHEVVEHLKNDFFVRSLERKAEFDAIERIIAEVKEYFEFKVQDEHHLRTIKTCCSIM